VQYKLHRTGGPRHVAEWHSALGIGISDLAADWGLALFVSVTRGDEISGWIRRPCATDAQCQMPNALLRDKTPIMGVVY